MTSDYALAKRAAELRQSFDETFARPRESSEARMLDLLSIRIAESPYAIRLTDIAGLHADKSITRIPGPIPEMLGIAGFRGAIVPVYDLRTLLGKSALNTPRWMVTAGAPSPIALAFDSFAGHLRVPMDFVVEEQQAEGHVYDVLQEAGQVYPVLSIPSILKSIEERVNRITS